MNENILLTIIEFISTLIIEGVILTFIFQKIANKTQQQQEQQLKEEMSNIEKQNKFDFEQLKTEINNSKTEIISQIKESSKTKG